MKRNHCKGFAALSLVLSLMIVALIAALAIAYLTIQQGGESIPGKGPVQRAKSVECLAQIRKIELQIQLYSVQNGRYPENLNVLDGLSAFEFCCPVTGDHYIYDPASGRISCPAHNR